MRQDTLRRCYRTCIDSCCGAVLAPCTMEDSHYYLGRAYQGWVIEIRFEAPFCMHGNRRTSPFYNLNSHELHVNRDQPSEYMEKMP